MQHCISSRQLESITLTIHDRMALDRQAPLTLTFAVFHTDSSGLLPSYTEQAGQAVYLGNDTFHFDIASAMIGTHFVELRANGEPVSNSPFLIEVTARDCVGAHEVASLTGECVCDQVSQRINGSCVVDSQYVTDKSNYVIGGIAVQGLMASLCKTRTSLISSCFAGKELFEAQYAATALYLNEKVGSLFDPPVPPSIYLSAQRALMPMCGR
jgi:hypothetical protein